jgi:hypothetical protein
MTPSGPTALTAFNNDFILTTFPILPLWTSPLVTFNHDPINPDLDLPLKS